MNASTVHKLYQPGSTHGNAVSAWSPTRITLSENESEWYHSTVKQLEELVRLANGWDGYDGKPVSMMNAIFALQILGKACWESTPAPQIVPLSDGGLQVEWHTLNGDLELLIRGPNSVRAWRSLDNNDDGLELEITNDVLPIANWVREITEPELELQAAA